MGAKPYVIRDFQQGTSEWLDWRTTGVSATDSVVLTGNNPYNGTALSLFRVKKGTATPEDLERNPHVRRGKEMEPQIRRKIEDKMKNVLGDMLLPLCVESCLQNPAVFRNYPLIASLDGITDKDEPVEMKAPSKRVWDEIKDLGTDSPAYQMYQIQVQHQILVTGAGRGHLIFGYRENKGDDLELTTFLVEKDPRVQQEILTAAEGFANCLQNDTAPPADPQKDVFVPEDTVSMQQWIATAGKLKELEAERAELAEKQAAVKGKMDALKDDLAAIKGEYKTGECSGVRVTTAVRAASTDYKAIAQEHAPHALGETKYLKPETTYLRVSFSEREQPKNLQDTNVQARIDHAVETQSRSYFSW